MSENWRRVQPVSGDNEMCIEICDVLGLKHVKKLDLHMEAGKPVTITAEFYPDADGLMQFPSILKKYELIEAKSK